MTSSVDARRQHMYDQRNPSISAERLDPASISSSPARLQSNQRSGMPVLGDPQMQSTTETDSEDETAEGKREQGKYQQQKERQETLSKIRKKLEGRTGFASYESYLESSRRDPMYIGPSYTDILEGCFRDPCRTGPGVHIIDVSNENSSPFGVSLRCEHLLASEISGALCRPPPSTRAQIVLWPINEYTSDSADFLDVLGVGLQLDPSFFETFRYQQNENIYIPSYRSKYSLSIGSLRTSVSVARSFALAQDNPVPVVLIAGPMHRNVYTFSCGLCYEDLSYSEDTSAYYYRAIYDLVHAATPYASLRLGPGPCLANLYIRALFNLLKGGGNSAQSSSDTLSACIIPPLQLEIALYRGELDKLRRSFTELKVNSCKAILFRESINDGLRDEAPESLYRYRTQLRSSVEYLENQEGALMGLLKSLCGPNFTEGLFYPHIKEARISSLGEARRLEAEIRDHLQLQGSKLALEESKKSIELSNNQIYESERVKIFTVLAFFYIPLNLATSVFGMNLQQLNRSGTSIGVFLGTAGVLLLVTGILWLFLESLQNARVLVSRFEEERQPDPPPNPSIFLRLYLIWWLSTNGLFVWMIRTGAGWCILINSSKGFQSSEYYPDLAGVRATVFVMKQMRSPKSVRYWLMPNGGGWLSNFVDGIPSERQ